MKIGFTEYEARAYVALIGTHPATAYEMARLSGIPSSKIYEVLSRLMERNLIALVDGGSGKKQYIPREADDFIEGERARLESTLDILKEDLGRITAPVDVSYIWNIHSSEALREKADSLIRGSRERLLVSGWSDELSVFESILKERERNGVSLAIVHFGRCTLTAGTVFEHPIEDTIYQEKGGRALVIVADSRTALMATVHTGGRVEGAWSMNAGFVVLAEDYIKHDIYIMKIVRRFDRTLVKKFGENFAMLRDVFSDREVL